MNMTPRDQYEVGLITAEELYVETGDTGDFALEDLNAEYIEMLRNTPGKIAQRLFEACTSERHQVDLTLPKTKSPSEFTRAMWRMEAKKVSA